MLSSPMNKLSENEGGIIVETDSFKAGLQFLKDFAQQNPAKRRLALVDVDNTVLTYAHLLVTDHWIDEEFKHLRVEGKSFDEIKELIIPLYISMVSKVHPEDIKLVEEDTPDIIRGLQQEGIDVLALTSRGSLILQETLKQLERFKINFNQGAYANRQKVLALGSEGLFENGIIMTGGQDKGKGLVMALEDDLPEFIMMWEDKLSNLEKVRNAIKEYNLRKKLENPLFTPVQFVGIRYSKLDAVVNNVNRHIAQCQLQYVDRILSDEHASFILRGEAKKTKKYYLDVQYSPQGSKLLIAAPKPETYQQLIKIVPQIEQLELKGGEMVFNGKPKNVRRFELSTEFYFSLREKDLIHPDQVAVLDPLLDKAVSLTPKFSALTLASSKDAQPHQMQVQQAATMTPARLTGGSK